MKYYIFGKGIEERYQYPSKYCLFIKDTLTEAKKEVLNLPPYYEKLEIVDSNMKQLATFEIAEIWKEVGEKNE